MNLEKSFHGIDSVPPKISVLLPDSATSCYNRIRQSKCRWAETEEDTIVKTVKSIASKVVVDYETGTLQPTSSKPSERHWGDRYIDLPEKKRVSRVISDLVNREWFERLWASSPISHINESRCLSKINHLVTLEMSAVLPIVMPVILAESNPYRFC